MDTEATKGITPENPEGEKKPPTPQEAAQAALIEAERIKGLRERLYARGETLGGIQRHAVPPQTMVSRNTIPVGGKDIQEESVADAVALDKSVDETVSYTTTMKRRHTFRKVIAIIGVLFFMGAAAVASLLMFSGNNTISGDNITLALTGQGTVGAGEILPFQIAVSNQNGVSIQSATLIIEYPEGTQDSIDGKELDTERKQLNQIGSGELINVELDARVFGEENEEKEIKVSIEYRIAGSNATFNKDAEPLHIKIGTSPVVITFNALKTVSTGQEYILPLTVQSNANVPLTDVLVKMSYPTGFDFTESDPDTISGEDVWKIATLKPGEKKVITVKGIITGENDERRTFMAKVGVAQSGNKNEISSILAQTQSEALIEEPFLKSEITVNGRSGNPIVVTKGEVAAVRIALENTLDSTIFDGRVSVEIEGNAFDEFSVYSSEGYYDSTKNTMKWDSSDTESLQEILPGHVSRLSFDLKPNRLTDSDPTITLKITLHGQRIFENNVPQSLDATTKQIVKVQSVASIVTKTLYDSGPFENSGPIPPVAEEATTYTLNLIAKSGTNELKDSVVTAELPQYVKWLNTVSEGDAITYNANSRLVTWKIGTIPPNSMEDAYIQVSMTPSVMQIQTAPNLLEKQTFVALDQFTGTKITSTGSVARTNYFKKGVEKIQSGAVQASE